MRLEVMVPLRKRPPFNQCRDSIEDLLAFQQRSLPDDLIEMDDTHELWVPKKAKAAAEAPSLL
jgi:hypothetical protein